VQVVVQGVGVLVLVARLQVNLTLGPPDMEQAAKAITAGLDIRRQVSMVMAVEAAEVQPLDKTVAPVMPVTVEPV
jgi:hypothetical protein